MTTSNADLLGLALAIRNGLVEEELSPEDQYGVLAMLVAMIAAERCGPDAACIRTTLDGFTASLGRIEFSGPDEKGYYSIGMPPRKGGNDGGTMQ